MGLFSDAWEKQKKKDKQGSTQSGGLFSAAWDLYKQDPNDYARIAAERKRQNELLTAQRRGGAYDQHNAWMRTIHGMTDEQIRAQVQQFRPSGLTPQEVMAGAVKPEYSNTAKSSMKNPYAVSNSQFDTASDWADAAGNALQAANKAYNTLVPVRTAKSGPETDEEALWHVINQSVMADKPDDMSEDDWAGRRIRVGNLGQFTDMLDFYKANYGKYSGKADTTMVRAMSRGEREDAAYNALRAKEYTAAANNAQKAQEAWEKAYINNNGEMPTFKGKMALGQVGALADAGLMPKLPTGQVDKAAFDAAVAREIANKQPLDPYQEWLQSYYQNNTLLGIDEQMDANKRRMADLTTGQTYGQEQGSAYLRDEAEYERLKGMVAKGQGFDTFTPEQRELWSAYGSGNGLEWSNDRYAQGNKTYEKAAVDNEVLSANRANIVAQRNYQAAAGQPDFKANSVRDTAQKDDLYNFVNDRGGKGERANEIAGIATTLVDEGKWLDKGYGFLNRNEIAYYNYIVKTQGLEAGQRVLDELAPELALRRAKDVAEDAGAFAKKYGGWSTLATYGTNLVSGLTAPFRAVDAMFNPDHSYLSSMYDNQVFTDKVREVRGAEWGKATDKWQISLGDWKIEFGPELGQYLYGLQTSGGDMLTAMAVGKGVQLAGGSAAAMKNTVQAIMSSEAGGSTMYQAMESGIDPRKAVVLGLGSAAIEALTEKYSIEALLKKPDLIRTYLAQNIITEGSEEGASNLLNLAWDTMVLGDQGDIMTAYNAALEANGGNEKAAARTVLLDKLAELSLDVLGGAIMGGGMASAHSVTTAVKRGNVGKTINTNNTYNQLRDIAAAMDKDSSAYKIANAATEGGKISNAQAGRLYSALMETLDEQSAATIKEAQVREVTQRLRDLGETGNIGAVADALQQLWMGQRLSSDQRKAISTSRYGQQVANEIFALDGDWAKGAADRVQQARQRNAMTAARAQHLASKSYQKPQENKEASELLAKGATTAFKDAADDTTINLKANIDGKEATIQGVERMEGGNPVFSVQVGDEVRQIALPDMKGTLDSYNMAAVVGAMKGMTSEAANTMLNFYKDSEGISGDAFARGWKAAYNAGRTALGMAYVNTNRLASALSQSAREAAYAEGEKQYQGEKPAAQETAPKAPRSKGKVTFEKGTDLRTSKLTRGQRSAIGVARMLAQITGINFEFYRSTADKDGRYTRANGSYDPNTNTITLDLNAGRNEVGSNAEFAVLRTASHELTHYIAQNSKDMYRRLQTFVLDNLIELGKDMDMLVAEQMDRSKQSGITIDEATAIEEVVADACEMMLKDTRAVETLAEKDNGLFVHIRNWLRKFYGQLKQAFNGLAASRMEAIALTKEDKDGTIRYIEGLQQLWDQAFVAAVEGDSQTADQLEKVNSAEGTKFQARDYSSLSEREILAGADPNAFKNAGSREYLKRYQAALRELEKLQDKLTGYQEEALKEGISRADREAAEARAKIAETQLARQEEKLSKLEGEPEFQRALAAERQTLTEAVKGMTPEKVAVQIERLEKEKDRIATASAEELDNMSLALEMNLGRKAAQEARKAEERMTKQAERAEQKQAEADERIESLKEQNQELRQELKHAAKEAKAQSDWDVAAKDLALEMNLGRKREIMRKAYEQRIAKLKSQSAQKLAAANQRGRDRLERYKERTKDTQSRSKLRDRIKRKVHDLDKLLRSETDVKHVPPELKSAAAQFLLAFTDDSSVFRKAALDELRYAYGKINEANIDEVGDIANLYDPNIAMIMDTLRPILDGRRLSELDQFETRQVLDLVDHFTYLIKMANKAFFADRRESISTLGLETIEAADKEKRFSGKENPVMNLLRNGMLTPAYFFKKLGGPLKKLYDGLKEGESRWGKLEMEARDFFLRTAEKHHYWDWNNVKDDTLTMTTQEGHQIVLTREQALGLYATWKRENSDNGQEAGHLREGGFVYEDAMKQDKKTKEISVDTSKPNRMSDADMVKVSNWLTDEQRAYADEMVAYMSGPMAELGNEVSMTLFGYKKYNESYYFPYQSSQNYIYTPLGQGAATNDNRLKHASFSNQTVKHANNPIIASDFTTVWAGHVNHMILYGSMCVPLENFNRVYNYRMTDVNEETGEKVKRSVKASIEGAYGRQAMKYIETLMTDLNGGMRTQSDGIASWLTSRFKKNAVFASWSVVAQQPSSIVRAMALVDPKYFAPGIAMRGSWDELKKYSGTAIIKEMGGFDTATGRSTRDWLLHRDPKGMEEKGKAFIDPKDSGYRDEVMGKLPALADRLAWTQLWRAVKAETLQNTGFAADSQELLEAAGKRFDEVVSYTQVYDSVLSKSQVMRSKDGLTKMTTAFMAEPTLAFNLLADAFTNRGKADSVKRTRAVAAYTATAVVNAILKSIVTAARDDDDRAYGEKYLGELVDNFTNDANPINLVPYARDVWSIFQGYDVERADMSIIADLKGSLDKIMDKDATPDVIVKEVATSVGMFLGLPVKNVWRDTAAVVNVYNSMDKEFTPEGAKYAMLEALPFYDDRTSAYYARLLDAYLSGNTSEQESLTIYLTNGLGKAEKTIKTQTKTELGKRYKAGKVDDETALDLLTDVFGVKEADAYWQLKEWKAKAEFTGEDDEFSFSRMGALKEALSGGNAATIRAAQQELLANGYKQKDVDSNTRSAIKAMYKDGSIDFAKAKQLLMAHGGTDWLNGKDKNDWYWLEQEYAYDKNKADDAPAWSKYNRLKTAMQTNKDVKGAIKELLNHGVQKGEISGQISDMFKETYVNLYKTNKNQALALQERLLDWYVAAGYKRDERIKHIKKNWLK